MIKIDEMKKQLDQLIKVATQALKQTLKEENGTPKPKSKPTIL